MKHQSMPEESTKDKIARQDHDTLIRVESVVNNMATDLKTLADGSAIRLTTAEARLTALEKINDETKPRDIFLTVTEHDRSLRDLKTTYKTIVWFVGGTCTALGIVTTLLSKFFGLLQ